MSVQVTSAILSGNESISSKVVKNEFLVRKGGVCQLRILVVFFLKMEFKFFERKSSQLLTKIQTKSCFRNFVHFWCFSDIKNVIVSYFLFLFRNYEKGHKIFVKRSHEK